ncbi:MAG TPA: class II aldolase/adducin family protein [Beijerinckiaceae bacterium]|jgi:ribulose-5-phosphate 4-epimerase/fuculose-1-phosphate aldolase
MDDGARTDEAGAQARLRREVAIVTRILVMEGILDYSGHVSARLPGRDAYVIQPGEDPRSDVSAGRMLVVDFDGRVLEGAPLRPPVETPIHGEIYRARPDVQAIVHSHMELAIAFTMMEGVRLTPMRARAARWANGIPTDPDPSHIKLKAQGEHLARTLGGAHAALMRAHGLVLTAESPAALLVDAVHFEENARALMQTLQAGAKPLPLTPAEIEQIERHEMRAFHVGKLWAYYLRKAETAGVLTGV